MSKDGSICPRKTGAFSAAKAIGGALRLLMVLLAFFMPLQTLAAESSATQAKKQPSLILFYHTDCAPCNAEIQEISDFKKTLPYWNIAIASLSTPTKDFSDHLKNKGIRLIDLSSTDSREVLLSMNDGTMALPFSMAFTSKHAVCGRHIGLLGLDLLTEWKQACSS